MVLFKMSIQNAFKRMGTFPMKVTFEIEGSLSIVFSSCSHIILCSVQSVLLPMIRGLEADDLIHVAFERGSKLVSTKEHQLGDSHSSRGGTKTIFNEVLLLPVTLFRNSLGEFQVPGIMLCFCVLINSVECCYRRRMEH